MLTERSLSMLFDVLFATRGIFEKGGTITADTYRQAVRTVARKYSRKYQTIGDLCTKRLKLSSNQEFWHILEHWFKNNANPLKELIVNNAPNELHSKIDGFFANPIKNINQSVEAIPDGNIHVIYLANFIQDKIKVIAGYEGITIQSFIEQLIQTTVQNYRFNLEEKKYYQKVNIGGFTLFKKVYGENYTVWFWSTLLPKVCEILNARHKDNFEKTIFNSSVSRYFSHDKSTLPGKQGKLIAGTNIYVSTKLNHTEIKNRCRKIMELFGENPDELEIHLRA